MSVFTRSFLFGVCGTLFFASAVASGKGIGPNRAMKSVLNDKTVVNEVARANGLLPTEVNSKNFRHLLVSSANGAKNLLDKAGKGIQVLALIGAVALVAATPGEAADSLDAKKINKTLREANVTEAGDEFEFSHSSSLFGSYFSSNVKDSALSAGIGADVTARRGTTEARLSLAAKSINNKGVSDDRWDGAEDYTSRLDIQHGFNVGVSGFMPIVSVGGGSNWYGKNKQLADLTGGIGFKVSGDLFGKRVDAQISGGFGGLGIGQHVDGAYQDLDWRSVATIGVALDTQWITLGDVFDAADGSFLYIVPVVPGSNIDYIQYHDTDDFDQVTRSLRAVMNLTKEIGVEVDISKSPEDVEAHKSVMAKVKWTDLF